MKNPQAAADAHTPVTLMALFANAFRLERDKSLLWLKGVYRDRERGSYGGYYFDRLKDEMSGQIVTIKVPEQIKHTLRHEGRYLFKGILDKDVRSDGVIEPVFIIAELVSLVTSASSPATTTRADLQRQKATAGYRDLDRALEQKLYAGERPRIVLIYGKTSIVHADVNSALKKAAAHYELTEHRTNLLARDSIIRALAEFNSDQYDAVAVVRGGGVGLEVLDDVRIAQVASKMQPIFITAIGHAQDVTLLQQVADKYFATPTALGVYLREVVERVRNEKSQGSQWQANSMTLISLAVALLVVGLVLGILLSRIVP